MDMRLEQTSFEAEIPCGSCKTRFTVEGDVTLPGSLRETTNILHASAMAVVESAEASQDRATIAGRVIFCVLYTQGDHGTPESIEAAADFTHLCDMPGAVPRSAVDAWAQAEHVTASVQNGRVSMKAVLSLCARAVCTQTAEALSAAKGDFVQQKTDQITLRRKTASGTADTLLREEFSLPADLAVTETLAAWADVQMLDATGGQGRIGLSGEVTLTVAHASSQPGRPLIMTRHTIPVGESVEVAGDGGDMLRGRIRVKDVAVASQDLGDGERTLRAEVLLGMNAWAEREETVAVLADAYTTSGEALRLNRAPMTLRTGGSQQHIAESGKASLLLPDGAKPLRTVLAAFARPSLGSFIQQGSRLIAEGTMEVDLVYMSDGDQPVSARVEVPFRAAFAATAVPEDILTLRAVGVDAVPITSDRAELRYILQADIESQQAAPVSLVTEGLAVPADAPSGNIILYFTQPGESAWDIARRYRIPESDLRALNPDLAGEPKPGQGLVIWHKNLA